MKRNELFEKCVANCDPATIKEVSDSVDLELAAEGWMASDPVEAFIAGAKWQKEQKPNIELIQQSWYMEGYHDREFGKEPKWIIKTGEGGPRHEPNPRYGQPLAKEQKYIGLSETDIFFLQGVANVLVDNEYKDAAKRLRDLSESLYLQPKGVWREEDERLIKTTIAFLKDFADTGWENAVECIDWLKYLPMRCLKSSDNWKPSEEQKEADLEKASRNVYESWMGGTMNDVRRGMAELGKVLNARKADEK